MYFQARQVDLRARCSGCHSCLPSFSFVVGVEHRWVKREIQRQVSCIELEMGLAVPLAVVMYVLYWKLNLATPG